MIRWSQYFLPTLREDPKDAESISHKLMLRAGLIRRLGSGAYSYLPLGFRALQRAIAIVREEMNRGGARASNGGLVGAEEIAHYLEVDVASVVEWAASGRLPAQRDGNNWKFDRSKVDEWLAQEKTR